jgi:hypothetical protein
LSAFLLCVLRVSAVKIVLMVIEDLEKEYTALRQQAEAVRGYL